MLHSFHVAPFYVLHFFHVALFFVLLQVARFLCCTHFVLHFFCAAIYSSCILFMWHHFGCCILFKLHSFFIAPFFVLHSFRVALFVLSQLEDEGGGMFPHFWKFLFQFYFAIAPILKIFQKQNPFHHIISILHTM